MNKPLPYCSTPAVPVQREAQSKQEGKGDVQANKYGKSYGGRKERKRNLIITFFFLGTPHRADSHSFASLVAAGCCSVNMQWNGCWGCLRGLRGVLMYKYHKYRYDANRSSTNLHTITNPSMYCTRVWRTRRGGREVGNKISNLYQIFFLPFPHYRYSSTESIMPGTSPFLRQRICRSCILSYNNIWTNSPRVTFCPFWQER
ncbi:hypothetical protein HOY82DRAFT_548825 [Tuber indicum]|nr:hypothetical protein HOY82DRAFT_548825 [Tuber indicum]